MEAKQRMKIKREADDKKIRLETEEIIKLKAEQKMNLKVKMCHLEDEWYKALVVYIFASDNESFTEDMPIPRIGLML